MSLVSKPTHGIWTAPFLSNFFGEYVDIHMKDPLIVLMRGSSGWKFHERYSHVYMAHQIYKHNLISITKTADEIVAISLVDAHWVTIWAVNEKEVSYPRVMRHHEAFDHSLSFTRSNQSEPS